MSSWYLKQINKSVYYNGAYMKRQFYNLLIMVLVIPSFLISQTITGKLVDINGIGLSGLQLKLYIYATVFSSTSGSDGSFTFNNVTSVKEGKKLPTGYSVSENFPNPFNPKTRIFITLPNSGNVKMNIYNVLGQKVLGEIDKNFNAGTSYMDLELKGLPNGIYLTNISIDEKYKVVKKIMLLYGSQHLNTSVVTEPNIGSLPNILSKAGSTVPIDSLVVAGSSINKIEYINLPSYTGVPLNLGSLKVNTACIGIPTVTYAGQTYNTVQIGTQCWLRENLNVGTMIESTKEQTNNGLVEKYCYKNNQNNCAIYGGLYEWAEAVQYQNGADNSALASPTLTGNVQGICPTGWHIPSTVEFKTLKKAINNNGNTLKAVGQGIINAFGDGRGTNSSGFSALLAGWRYVDGRFFSLAAGMDFWSSTEGGVFGSYELGQYSASSVIDQDYESKNTGFSVRCCKD